MEPKGLTAEEAGNAENPGDPKLEASGLLNENGTVDAAPKAGVEEEVAEPVEGPAPKAGGLPNTAVFPAGVVANAGFVLKLKSWTLLLLLLFTGKPTKIAYSQKTEPRHSFLLLHSCVAFKFRDK